MEAAPEMDAAKQQLVERFRTYLETADTGAAEADPDAPDLFTLLAELMALKNEVKLESRQVKGALEQFREVFDTLRLANERLSGELHRHQQQQSDSAAEAEQPLLIELIELRDRLQAGHVHADSYKPGWLARRGHADRFVAGMAEGLAMNLRRLDETLIRWDVRPIDAVGQSFDPRVMSTVDVVGDPARRNGEVISEVRVGYLRGRELLRTADVIVNKLQD